MKTICICDLQSNEVGEIKKQLLKGTSILDVGVRKTYHPGRVCEIPYVVVETDEAESEFEEYEFKFLENGDSPEDGYDFIGTIALTNGVSILSIFYRKS